MKKLFIPVFLLFLAAGSFAQETTKKVEDVVKFKDSQHSFGKIKQGTPVTFDFEFSNISATPVVIENASASCGCTTPVWPQAPIMQEKTDKIKAGFNAAAAGKFEKSIYVKVKGIDYPYELKISGEVLNAEDYAKYEAENKNKKTGSK